ncbi:MAG: endonuclease domain-containing protein [Burkholderiales bacterium]
MGQTGRPEWFNVKGQSNKKLLKNKTPRNLRARMTDAELRLWRSLRSRQMSGFKFRRQHPFGDYVLDFVCLEHMLVIEVDGRQHVATKVVDELRTKKLLAAGFRVLRFWNNEVIDNIEAVKNAIWRSLKDPSLPRSGNYA